jgi:hypothetical protein
MAEPIKIVLFLDGGVIQDILISSGECEAYVIDYDIEGVEPEDIMMVSFSASEEGKGKKLVKEQACVSHWDKLQTDPKFIYQLEEDFKKHEKQGKKSKRRP